MAEQRSEAMVEQAMADALKHLKPEKDKKDKHAKKDKHYKQEKEPKTMNIP